VTPQDIAALLPDDPPKRVPGPPPKKRAAVALVLRPGAGPWPELLMIKRSEHPDDPWSGHMAFPGGREEASDPNLLATAIRETREELDLDLGPATRLGCVDPVYSPSVAKLRVDAWVFALDDVPPLRPNQEVQSTHWFALDRFLRHEGRATFPFTWKGNKIAMPCARLDDCFIWGMSLRMIDDLLDRLRVRPDVPRP